MLLFRRFLISLTATFILSAVLSAATVIVLMFTKGQEFGHHVGLFGSVFFEARRTPSGSIMVGMGVENPLVLSAVFAAIFLVSTIFVSILSALRDRKKALQCETDDERA